MSSKEKLLDRLLSRRKDFSWSDLQTLMRHLGYEEKTGSGSRRKFIHTETKRIVSLHKRHPDNTLLDYQIKEVLNFLKQEGNI
jgi:hypothetical protein